MDFKIIDSYIDGLIDNSTIEIPAWNIEKARAGKMSGWDYIDGCMIMAILELYAVTGKKKYFEFAEKYENARIHEDGTIDGYKKEDYNLDDINGGKNLITLYKLTGKEKYARAAAKLFDQLVSHPRTAEGNFWHKKIYPNQVWLDGLYMALPFLMEYEAEFEYNEDAVRDIYGQFFSADKKMRDKKTGLYYHAYDSSKSAFWADKKTGLSEHFWLRSLGWYSMAMLDTLNKSAKKNTKDWLKLKKNFSRFMASMLKYQDKSGMWYQIPNLPDRSPNYLETSGSAIIAYSLLKGVRTKILEDNVSDGGRSDGIDDFGNRGGFGPGDDFYGYDDFGGNFNFGSGFAEQCRRAGEKAFERICNNYLINEDGKISLGGICLSAGLGPQNNLRRNGSFEYYMSEPIVKDDAKGSGPFILAYSEYMSINKVKQGGRKMQPAP
ncbi:glycoside hydrolase family 88/105 protein [Treponema parvum]|uniref:glycoside hydrolase family 88/105 protein n=1 Tax=Treponema parvum TaxID=138851 RepID=UPI001FE62B2F|nr:glycoside hydrolase family 88 protein [Treponema parvum]